MRAKLREIKDELRRRRHWPIPEQGQWLKQVVAGFFAYHAVPTNGAALSAFRYHVTDLWRRSLQRRSQRNRCTWERMRRLANAWLPQPRILHPWPQQRFAVKHPRWEPYAGVPHVRIYAGCALKAHVTQSPGMAAAAKLSQQPRTESCVVSGNGHCEA